MFQLNFLVHLGRDQHQDRVFSFNFKISVALFLVETKQVCSQNRGQFSNFCFSKFQEVVLKLKSLKVNYFERLCSLGWILVYVIVFSVKYETDGKICSWFSVVVGCRTIFDINACSFLQWILATSLMGCVDEEPR